MLFGGWDKMLGWILSLFSKQGQELLARRFRGPSLKVDFENDDGCLHLTPEDYQEQLSSSAVSPMTKTRVVCFARIRITNSKPQIAKKCRAWLTAIDEFRDGEFVKTNYQDSLPLIWSYDAEATEQDIPKGVVRYVDLVRIQNAVKGFDLQIHGKRTPLSCQHVLSTYGTLRFRVIVASENHDPVERTAAIEWSGEWPPRIAG